MEKIDYLIDKTNVLSAELTSLSNEFSSYKTETDNDISALQNDVGDLQGDVTDLENDVTNLQNASTSLGNDITNLQTDVSGLQSSVGTLQTSVTQINNILCKQNLLINGDFKVNQRGFSTISGSGYTVDRWHNYDSNSKITLNSDNSLTLKNISSNSSYGYFIQYLDPTEENMWGKTYTMSCKFNDGQIISGLVVFPDSFSSICDLGASETYNRLKIRAFLYSAKKVGFTVDIKPNANATIVWCKLEEGSVATAFSPRSYTEELALCQRYYQKITPIGGTGTYLNLGVARNSTLVSFSINLTQTLKKSPTIKSSDITILNCNTGGSYTISNNSLTLQCLSSSSVTLNYTSSSSIGSKGNVFFISDTNGKAKIEIDAESY